MIKRTADIVIENSATKSMILSIRIKPFEGLIDMLSKNPNRNAENVVKTALSLISDP